MLIECPQCESPVSSSASACPKCGQPIASAQAPPVSRLNQPAGCLRTTFALAGFALTFLLVMTYCSGGFNTSARRASAPASNAQLGAAMAAVLAEPSVLSTNWLPSSLEVRVADDGTLRNGFAMYLCGVLRDNGAAHGMSVYVVDDRQRTRRLGSYACDRDTR